MLLTASAFVWVLLVRDNGVDVLSERIKEGGHQACMNRFEEFSTEYKKTHPKASMRYLCRMLSTK